MGLYDDITCKYPLPRKNEKDQEYQTKDLICFLEKYEIREDGTLWREKYDIEDRSNPNKKGIERWFGIATRVNPRWIQEASFTGEVAFYRWDKELNILIEFSAYFIDGKLKSIVDITNGEI